MSAQDGGAAFPRQAYWVQGMDGGAFPGQRGMSLRDWFASGIKVPEDLSSEFGEKLIGRPHPLPQAFQGADCLEVAKWWAEVSAAYRYLHADAMLRARAAQVTP